MLIKENRIVWVSLFNSWSIFFVLVLFRYGGIHLADNIASFIDFYTAIIFGIVLFPSFILLIKWVAKRQYIENYKAIIAIVIFCLVLFLYYN